MASRIQIPLQAQAFLDAKSGTITPTWFLFFTKFLGAVASLTEYTRVAPVSGQTVAMPTQGNLVLKPAGTLAALTVTLPTPIDGQTVGISTTQAITALTVTGTGVTVVAPASLSANQAFRLVYCAPDATWYPSA
jgi:hypothetical protein